MWTSELHFEKKFVFLTAFTLNLTIIEKKDKLKVYDGQAKCSAKDGILRSSYVVDIKVLTWQLWYVNTGLIGYGIQPETLNNIQKMLWKIIWLLETEETGKERKRVGGLWWK